MRLRRSEGRPREVMKASLALMVGGKQIKSHGLVGKSVDGVGQASPRLTH